MPTQWGGHHVRVPSRPRQPVVRRPHPQPAPQVRAAPAHRRALARSPQKPAAPLGRRPRPLPPTRRNAAKIVSEGKRVRASGKQRLSAVATALVESHLRNVRHGDRDSLGLFQQRPSQGWGSRRQILNPRYAARRYYGAAKQVDRPGLSAGGLAAQVQRPAAAYRGRYSRAIPLAQHIIREIRKARRA